MVANNLSAILDAVDIFFGIMYSGNLHAGQSSNYVLPVISGEGHYTFHRGSGLDYYNDMRFEFIDGSFKAVGMGMYGGYTITNNGEYATVGWYSAAGNSALHVSDTAGFTFFGVDYDNSPIAVSSYVAYEQGNRWNTTLSASYPATLNNLTIGSNTDRYPVITNIDTLKDRINSLYIPLKPGSQYTYQQAADIIIDAVNVKYPDLNITIEDLPPESNYLPTEPTDPTEPTAPSETVLPGGSFEIDYGEIISPSELESILGQETYQVDTVVSLDILAVDMPQLDTLPQDMVVAAGALMTAVTPLFTETGLLPIFLPLAIVMILVYFLRRGR